MISIYPFVFNKCTNLESVGIPKSVTEIDEYAFWGCDALAQIITPAGSYAEQWAKENGYEDKLVLK